MTILEKLQALHTEIDNITSLGREVMLLALHASDQGGIDQLALSEDYVSSTIQRTHLEALIARVKLGNHRDIQVVEEWLDEMFGDQCSKVYTSSLPLANAIAQIERNARGQLITRVRKTIFD